MQFEASKISIRSGRQPLVVKIGSSLLVKDNLARIEWMHQLAVALRHRPGPVLLVSSGAIALGRAALGLEKRPQTLAEAQAAAAVGQIRLAQLWSEVWAKQQRATAQVLLTLGDLEDRGRYLNARNTIKTLLKQNIIPIVNENDTVATGEIRFGDNDRLAARVAQLTRAELLVLLSDVDGLFDANPETSGDARLLTEVPVIDASVEALADDTQSTAFGTGGMRSKLAAARIATAAGCPVLLTNGSADAEPFARYFASAKGTRFAAAEKPLILRKQWLRGLQKQAGILHLDAGACAALGRGSSLLAAGLHHVEGEFERGALVGLHSADGAIGQGLCGYASDEARKLIGLKSDQYQVALGYGGRGAIVHRDDLVLFD
ncbi:MAG: glutamate 5-kinase [Pseudomonadota bacterium]